MAAFREERTHGFKLPTLLWVDKKDLQHLKQCVKSDARITKTSIWGTFELLQLEYNCIRQVN